MWKKAYERKKRYDVFGWLDFFTIDIDGITQGLKSIETDANRQYYIERTGTQFSSKKRKGRDKTINEEIIIFELTKNAYIQHYISNRDYPEFMFDVFISSVSDFLYQHTADPTKKSGSCH